MRRRIKAGGIYQPTYRNEHGTLVKQEVWWIHYSKDGRQFRQSAKTKSAEEAERTLKKIQGDIVTGRFQGQEPERIRMSALLDLFLADYRRNERSSLYETELKLEAHVRPALGALRVADFGTANINRYIEFRRAEKAANGTINRELAIVRRALRLAAAEDPPLLNRFIVVKLLPEDNVREGFLYPHKYRLVLEALPEELKPVLVYAYHLGSRRGELLQLKRTDIDLKALTIRFSGRTTKNKEAKVAPIYGEMIAWTDMLLSQLQNYPGCIWLFHRRGKRIKNFRKAWDVACELAGIPELLFHDLRRSAVKNMEDASIPRKTAMQITGHKTESIYRRYHIVSERDIREAGAKLAKHLGERESGKRARLQ